VAFFNSKRYNPSTSALNVPDPSDMMAMSGRVIGFKHIPSGKSIYFKAFITTFNDGYSSDWASEPVFGRADPIYSFKNTTRRITIAFKVPAHAEGEAYENLAKVQQLIQFLYPAYTEIERNATTIAQSPLVRLSFMNLVGKSAAKPLVSESPEDIFSAYTWVNEPDNGLLGAIMNLTVNHNLENPNAGIIEKGGGDQVVTILPTYIDVNLDFAPIHEHTLGWTSPEQFGTGESFPYGAPINPEFSMGPPDPSETQVDENNTAAIASRQADRRLTMAIDSADAAADWFTHPYAPSRSISQE